MRRAAWEICLGFVRAEEMARARRLTEVQARHVVAEMVERATGQAIAFQSAREWFEQWVRGKAESRAPATAERYRQAVRDFLASLGPRADLSIEAISKADVERFRAERRKSGVSARTLNQDVRIIAICLGGAQRQGIVGFNAARAVDSLPVEAREGTALTMSRRQDRHGSEHPTVQRLTPYLSATCRLSAVVNSISRDFADRRSGSPGARDFMTSEREAGERTWLGAMLSFKNQGDHLVLLFAGFEETIKRLRSRYRYDGVILQQKHQLSLKLVGGP